jgi:hypothetical protein
MYIDECVLGIDAIMHCDELIATPINLGSSELIAINTLVSLAEEIGGITLERKYDLNAPRGVAGRNSDNTFIQQMLGWEPSLPFRDGLAKTYAWIEPIGLAEPAMADLIGAMPYRIALAGGWIDQPFVSRLNPTPPGSMVVVSLEPLYPFMERCGMGTSTRKVAMQLWGNRLPDRPPAELVRELYDAENAGKPEPSGSQDMAGLIYPGVSRLDYDFTVEGGCFPAHVESNTDPAVAGWLENVIHMIPILQRPAGYGPLGEKHLDVEWIERLGQTGKNCFNAIAAQDAAALGASLNECMACWEALLPQTVRHPTIKIDLMAFLKHYQTRYAGAMYSGCGGGYLFVISEEAVPGAIRVKVRLPR